MEVLASQDGQYSCNKCTGKTLDQNWLLKCKENSTSREERVDRVQKSIDMAKLDIGISEKELEDGSGPTGREILYLMKQKGINKENFYGGIYTGNY
jgi:hypothetical protein